MRKLALLFSISLIVLLSACGAGASKDSIDVITFTDAGWDSVRVHNSIAQFIVEEGYGYKTDVTNGTTAATLQSLEKGDINVNMEIWTDNVKDVYEKAIENGTISKALNEF